MENPTLKGARIIKLESRKPAQETGGYVRASYGRFNAVELVVAVGGGDNEWQVAAYVRNITNSLSRTGGIDFINLTGFVNEPRKWDIKARMNF